ncbi:MAG: histidine phosphatase family protein [Candidatus Thorarchaeota archaeon]|nr:histidine phosphatase family protein [Candidatus Thorarchaeota archaeon]
MFELVQKGEPLKALGPRTQVYVVTHAEPDDNNGDLSERGINQAIELARSRVMPLLNAVFAEDRCAIQTAAVIAKEYGLKVDSRSCLSGVSLRSSSPEQVLKFWNSDQPLTPKGESRQQARKRIGECITKIAELYRDGVVAIVTDPAMSVLFDSLVVGRSRICVDVEDWLEMGFAACACYEYGKHGWSTVMRFDNSYLSEPTGVMDTLPSSWRVILGGP